MLIAESPDGNYSRRKNASLCLVEALPAEVVALGISICDTTRDGSRIVGNPYLGITSGLPVNRPEQIGHLLLQTL